MVQILKIFSSGTQRNYRKVLPFLSLNQAKIKELKTMNIKQNSKEEEISVLTKELAEIKEKNKERDKLLDELLNNPTILKELYEKKDL